MALRYATRCGDTLNDMEETNLTTWEEFERELKEFRQPQRDELGSGLPPLFRGQHDSSWLLSTTLERERKRMRFADYYRIIHKIRPQIESLMGAEWPIPDYSRRT